MAKKDKDTFSLSEIKKSFVTKDGFFVAPDDSDVGKPSAVVQEVDTSSVRTTGGGDILPPETPTRAVSGQVLPPDRTSKTLFGTTLREALESKKDTSVTNQSNYLRTVKRLESMGFDVDLDLSYFNDQKVIKDIVLNINLNMEGKADFKVGGTSFQFTPHTKADVGTHLKALIGAYLPQESANAVSTYEKKMLGQDKAFAFDFQIRRKAKNIILPEVDIFNRGVHQGIRNLTSKEAKIFALTKLLTGLRDPDILNIRIKPGKAGEEVAFLRKSTKTVASISNKGRKIDYSLGKYIYEILDELRADAEKAGRDTLFTQSKATLTKEINKSIRASLAEVGGEILNADTEKVKEFTLGDLRKNLFDILEEEYGYIDANRALGHSTKDVGLGHYKPGRRGRIGKLGSSLDLFFRLYAEDIGFLTPKALVKSYGLETAAENVTDKPFSKTTSAEDLEFERRLQDLEEGTTSKGGGAAKDLEKDLDKLERAADRKEAVLERLKTTGQQMEELTGTTTGQKQVAGPDRNPSLDLKNTEVDFGYLDTSKENISLLNSEHAKAVRTGDFTQFDSLHDRIVEEIEEKPLKPKSNVPPSDYKPSRGGGKASGLAVLDPEVSGIGLQEIKDMTRGIADSVKATGNAVINGVSFAWDKIPAPVKKAIPILGMGMGVWIVYQRAMEDKAKYAEGEWPLARQAKFLGQGAEEVFSILPLTTTDIEEINEYLQTEAGQRMIAATEKREAESMPDLDSEGLPIIEMAEDMPSLRDTQQYKEVMDLEDPEGLTAPSLEQQMQESIEPEPSDAGMQATATEDELGPIDTMDRPQSFIEADKPLEQEYDSILMEPFAKPKISEDLRA